ncbi:3-oxoacyl-(acyl-carrier-protein) synthase III [Chitinivorax tropicus]|uniref:3-oxoacyl-(Acyl-carrier-protein) synthase III n=1 Tax=Chitinivorax tropicus TaxID=714531 RepID=A0A840MM62_9PROT|nr:3-oxoacyl-[acyl-carrier-protein] synthase III C-terminal domain-containing protein [Chitinivorax tropicus]MBB5017616.1 3-oxoacyl-(acyl-carrier-protein) synthase III [Chitinivorax tropicus]
MTPAVQMASLAYTLPSRLLRNDDPAFDRIEGIQPAWWQFWGIESRYVVDETAGESELTLAWQTAARALDYAGIEAAQLDLVLTNITSPFVSHDGTTDSRHFAPRLSGLLKAKLGAHRALHADIEVECASFLFQMQTAVNLIKQGRIQRALICSTERMSALVDYTCKSSTNFGDGAAAAVLTAANADEVTADWVDAVYHSDAQHYDLATVQWRYPKAADTAATPDAYADQFGAYFTLKPEAQEAIARFMPETIPDMVNQLLRKTGHRADDIHTMVFHQPSKILVEAWAQKLGLSPERYVIRLSDCACLVSASVPMALFESIRLGKIKPGDLVIIAGAGAGWGFGAQLWRWGHTAIGPEGASYAA